MLERIEVHIIDNLKKKPFLMKELRAYFPTKDIIKSRYIDKRGRWKISKRYSSMGIQL